MEHWIAWPWPPADAADAHWWALRFTPRVARLDEALLLEVSATERLWGGRSRLLALVRQEAAGAVHAQAPTVLQALALLRLAQAGRPPPRHVPQGLPLHTLTALRPHAASLARMGCRTWGDVRALPRAGLARRLGAQPLRALDQAWGDAPHPLPWLTCPERFETSVELPALADTADGLLHPAQPLLAALRRWLQARHQGVLALELGWRYALRRIDGVELPPGDTLAVRTAEPLQDMAHLHRLLAEHLAHRQLAAPVDRATLRALETAPWREDSGVLAPQGHGGQGEPWGQFVERLSARLGAGQVLVPQLLADHRPERMVQWRAAAGGPAAPPAATPAPDAALYPAWLVRPPRPLAVRGGRPCWHGPLRLLAGPQRLETGWWEPPGAPGADAETGLARRDYFVAHNAVAGTVWVFRERSTQGERWFLQGVYG
ncbi:MAG: DNA polymerase Y family protein [Acidovorax sp.]